MKPSNVLVAILIGLAAPGLGACVTSQDALNTWVGTTDAHLMTAWGVPNRQTFAGGGIRILTYRDWDEWQKMPCHNTFAVDADHRVIAASTTCR